MTLETLSAICEQIQTLRLDDTWRERAKKRIDSLTKPLGSLGRLEEVAEQFVVAREDAKPAIRNPAVYVFAADHGVTAEGVSAYPAEVTGQMVRNFLAGEPL